MFLPMAAISIQAGDVVMWRPDRSPSVVFSAHLHERKYSHTHDIVLMLICEDDTGITGELVVDQTTVLQVERAPCAPASNDCAVASGTLPAE